MSKPIAAKEIGQLLGQHAAALELYAAQWTLAAEDCVQEAFIELATQAIRPEVPVAWLYRVVRNRALNASRSARRRANHERLAAMLRQSTAIVPERSDDSDGLPVALDSLSSEERELIVLRIWSEMTWQQIGELAGTSSSSAHRGYVAALKKLKQVLESACPMNLNHRKYP